jgi:aryl-alcohol dehydrogenase-like predicted oxidoreductase
VKTRPLGHTGLNLSLVGLGCNNFGTRIDAAASARVVARALDLGINHFDTADIYGDGASEEILGKALGARRHDAVLATKFGHRLKHHAEARRGSGPYVTSAVEASLRRLGTDRIDLLTMHVPDRSTPIEETLGALERLRKAGKVRHFAASNFTPPGLARAASAAAMLGTEGFVACQDQWSLLHRRAELRLLPAMRRLDLQMIPYLPLAGGALTGKYRKDGAMPDGARHTEDAWRAKRFLAPHWDRIESLRAFATARGHTLLELAMSWLACQPMVVSILTGATRPDQVEANVTATGWALGEAERAEIDGITITGWHALLLRARLAPRHRAG